MRWPEPANFVGREKLNVMRSVQVAGLAPHRVGNVCTIFKHRRKGESYSTVLTVARSWVLIMQ